MKFPRLVPNFVCTTPIHIKLFSQEIGEYGESEKIVDLQTKCNYQASGKRVYTSKDTYIKLKGVALINGDITDHRHDYEFGMVTGECIVGGERSFLVHNICRARNIDGTVNYTRIELI